MTGRGVRRRRGDLRSHQFTEGAWLVVVLFPVLWLRLNRQYGDEPVMIDSEVAASLQQS